MMATSGRKRMNISGTKLMDISGRRMMATSRRRITTATSRRRMTTTSVDISGEKIYIRNKMESETLFTRTKLGTIDSLSLTQP